jgi:hypothetical protein
VPLLPFQVDLKLPSQSLSAHTSTSRLNHQQWHLYLPFNPCRPSVPTRSIHNHQDRCRHRSHLHRPCHVRLHPPSTPSSPPSRHVFAAAQEADLVRRLASDQSRQWFRRPGSSRRNPSKLDTCPSHPQRSQYDPVCRPVTGEARVEVTRGEDDIRMSGSSEAGRRQRQRRDLCRSANSSREKTRGVCDPLAMAGLVYCWVILHCSKVSGSLSMTVTTMDIVMRRKIILCCAELSSLTSVYGQSLCRILSPRCHLSPLVVCILAVIRNKCRI